MVLIDDCWYTNPSCEHVVAPGALAPARAREGRAGLRHLGGLPRGHEPLREAGTPAEGHGIWLGAPC